MAPVFPRPSWLAPALLATSLLPAHVEGVVAQQQAPPVSLTFIPVEPVDETDEEQGLADLRQLDPSGKNILYDHMPKAGGTYLINILRAAVGKKNFKKRKEFEGLSVMDKLSTFTMGSIRNPCDYYLSLWSYGVDHGGAMRHKVPAAWVYNVTSPMKDSDHDIYKFRDWVRRVNTKGKPGVMSVRFAVSYIRGAGNITGSLPPSVMDNTDLEVVQRGLRRFNKSSIDCWARGESLVEDTRRCLKQWHNNTGGKVNWDDFAYALKTADTLASIHAPCERYFNEEITQLVHTLEEPIFKMFDYSTCCASRAAQK